MSIKTNNQSTTSNQLRQFRNEEFGELEILTINGKPYFPATECAEKLGYAKARNAIERHCAHALKQGVGVRTGTKADGTPATQIVEKTFIPEGDLYRLIVRSKLPGAERFERWVFDEVLPTIRKYGAYATSDTLDDMLRSPEFAAEILNKLADERKKNAELSALAEGLALKGEYYDKVLLCDTLFPVSVIAKDYGMSAAAFNEMLRGFGVQYKICGTWLLYQKYANNGYTQTRTYRVGERTTTFHTCWTQKGRKFLYDILKWYGILPTAFGDAPLCGGGAEDAR
jgi:prophage antirepressor-like protein